METQCIAVLKCAYALLSILALEIGHYGSPKLVSPNTKSWNLLLAAGGDLCCAVERDFLERRVCGLAAIHLSLQARKQLFESRHRPGCAMKIGEVCCNMCAADKRSWFSAAHSGSLRVREMRATRKVADCNAAYSWDPHASPWRAVVRAVCVDSNVCDVHNSSQPQPLRAS
jgi:hypothetical protein